MANKKTLILDCDGTLYPQRDLKLSEFIESMQKVAKQFDISQEKYEKISVETKQSSPGMYNFIYALCDKDEKLYDRFIKEMVNNVDYSRIKKDDGLLSLIDKTKKNYDVIIFTNNTLPHLDIVLDKMFGKDSKSISIDCYDISSTKQNDRFYPKQSLIGLKLFSQKIGKNPKDCILVDDTQKNIDAAHNIGMAGKLITEEYTLHKYLNSLSNMDNLCLNKNQYGY